MNRHKCTLCRRKRQENFLKPVRDSNKPGSKVWICRGGCLDGRMNHEVQSILQDGLSQGLLGLSNEDHKLSYVARMANVPGEKFILDVCCGYRMFWFDKNNPLAVFCDINKSVKPEVVLDFRDIPYPDKSFKLVVFDPPHLFNKNGQYSWLNKKYGSMDVKEWPKDLQQGFNECMRVLEDYGILIFKWSQGDISVSTVLSLLPVAPLFGHTSDKKKLTHWLCFMKLPKSVQGLS